MVDRPLNTSVSAIMIVIEVKLKLMYEVEEPLFEDNGVNSPTIYHRATAAKLIFYCFISKKKKIVYEFFKYYCALESLITN